MRLGIFGLGLFLAIPASAKTIDVAAGESINQALAAAAPGDTILLEPVTFTEDLSLGDGGDSTGPITLQGQPGSVLVGSIDLGGDFWVIRISRSTRRGAMPFAWMGTTT